MLRARKALRTFAFALVRAGYFSLSTQVSYGFTTYLRMTAEAAPRASIRVMAHPVMTPGTEDTTLPLYRALAKLRTDT